MTTARRQAVAGIRGWCAERNEDAVRTAALLISELLTNAVKHTYGDRVSLLLQPAGPVLRIEVHYSSPELPHPGHPDMNSEHGRGLLLIAALADRHGTEPRETGKCCWTELILPTPAGPGDLHPPPIECRLKDAVAAPTSSQKPEPPTAPLPHEKR
ncbi:ATP-binding protein [Streptomyces ferrugineus]|uniref:ATP-binding protein n=1 Tax=Streptomyces ferrugineus TaxID=1413221 RepID=UPI002240392A|nr:ATP-binding protein [Streptomyces ferrugineus]